MRQPTPFRKVLIASANPLFGKGLQQIYHQRFEAVEFLLTSTMEETLAQLDRWQPDLVIVDYDDKTIHREEFLSHFITGQRPMQVMLVSLRESGAVVVYDRKTLTPAQADAWLSDFQPNPPSKRSHPMKGNTRHLLIAGGLVIVATALVYFALLGINLLPDQASTQAQAIDRLFNAHFFMIALLFSLITVFIGYSLFAFRSKPGTEDQPGANMKGNNALEIIWTLIPLATVLIFAFFGARNLAETRAADPQAMEVKVIARQWDWVFEYPAYGIKSNELYLPVNRQVLLKLTSLDVIHSFWVPEFRVKQDALPGENLVKELRITPIKEGKYTVMCAELCGGAHANMNRPVVVVSKQEFDAWVSSKVNAVTADPVERGKRWAELSGCLSCHSVDGTKLVGPTWKGAFGHTVELADGTTVTADDAYLYTSIVNPASQLVKGYPNSMPANYADQLSDEQIRDIIEYIKSLK